MDQAPLGKMEILLESAHSNLRRGELVLCVEHVEQCGDSGVEPPLGIVAVLAGDVQRTASRVELDLLLPDADRSALHVAPGVRHAPVHERRVQVVVRRGEPDLRLAHAAVVQGPGGLEPEHPAEAVRVAERSGLQGEARAGDQARQETQPGEDALEGVTPITPHARRLHVGPVRRIEVVRREGRGGRAGVVREGHLRDPRHVEHGGERLSGRRLVGLGARLIDLRVVEAQARALHLGAIGEAVRHPRLGRPQEGGPAVDGGGVRFALRLGTQHADVQLDDAHGEGVGVVAGLLSLGVEARVAGEVAAEGVGREEADRGVALKRRGVLVDDHAVAELHLLVVVLVVTGEAEVRKDLGEGDAHLGRLLLEARAQRPGVRVDLARSVHGLGEGEHVSRRRRCRRGGLLGCRARCACGEEQRGGRHRPRPTQPAMDPVGARCHEEAIFLVVHPTGRKAVGGRTRPTAGLPTFLPWGDELPVRRRDHAVVLADDRVGEHLWGRSMGALESWKAEKQSVYLYRVLAERDRSERRRLLFAQLAEAAEQQAKEWEAPAREQGRTLPARYVPTLRVRTVGWLVRVLGAQRLRSVLAAMKVRGLSALSEPDQGHPMPHSLEDVGRRHRGAGSAGTLRAAVFGANDGLVSNASLVLGVAAASGDPHVVLLAGTAGLLAGAFSMAAGEYVSVRAQREMVEHQIDMERQELAQYPAEEAAELSLIYEARGIPRDQARAVAERTVADPTRALDTLAREELGVDPRELASPLRAAVSSFLSFAIGAVIPLAPFVLAPLARPLLVAIALAAVALFGVGAAISLFTGRRALRGGLRMLLIGAAAGAATYLIGSLMGA